MSKKRVSIKYDEDMFTVTCKRTGKVLLVTESLFLVLFARLLNNWKS